jgi:heme/copper-type cytochrome/quinol oxidase subunit 2
MRRLVTLLLPIFSVVSLGAFFILPWFAFGSDSSTAWLNLQWAFTEQGNRLYIVMALIPLATVATLIMLGIARRRPISFDGMMLLNGLALLPFGYYYYDLLTIDNLQQQKLFNPIQHIQMGFWLHLAVVVGVFVLTIIFAMQQREQPEPPTESEVLSSSETQTEQAA